MAELKPVHKVERPMAARDRWLLDVEETEDVGEPEFDPYGGRFFSDELDSDLEDGLMDGLGSRHGLFDF